MLYILYVYSKTSLAYFWVLKGVKCNRITKIVQPDNLHINYEIVFIKFNKSCHTNTYLHTTKANGSSKL